jgi:hypothetical protein
MRINYYLISFLLLFFFSELSALPRFSLRGGSGDCSGCHVNPTGGNMRTKGGWSFGKNKLALISPGEDFKMSNEIGDNIQFGLDFRGQALLLMTESKTFYDFQRMTGSIYTNVDLSEKINVFARYDFIQDIWEAYGVARILPNDSYIKGGTFQSNYGIRIDDHTAYTRGGDIGLLGTSGDGLIYDPRYTETGAELGLYFGEELVLLTASVGNPRWYPFEQNSDLTWTANLKIMPEISDNMALFFGGSFASFRGSQQLGQFKFSNDYPAVKMFGGYVGFGIGDFTIMGEYDIANDYIYNDTASTAIMVEAAYRIIKGLEAVVRLDRFDPSSDIEKDELTRVVIGFEIFPYSFIEIRPQYRIQMEDPSFDNDAALIQFHIWY